MTDTSVFEDKKAAYYTLGCKLNFAETSTIGRSLLAQGVRSVRPREVADICLLGDGAGGQEVPHDDPQGCP